MNKTLYYLFKFLYKLNGKPLKPYPYQLEIAEQIYYKKQKRIVITATTRAGKTLIVSLTALLFALKYPNSKILLIAPSYNQAKLLMNYIAEHIIDNQIFYNNIIVEHSTDLERLRKEISKERITFKNNSSIQILSAEGKGQRLYGFGGNLIIVDESALISDEVYKNRILRMLGDQPDSILVEIGNPIQRNHFFEDFKDESFYKIRIGYKDCIKVERLTKEFIEEQRRKLTDVEFKILYEAEFPEDTEDSLFRYNSVKLAFDRYNKIKEIDYNNPIYLGVDVARFGIDYTVFTVIEDTGENYIVREIISKAGQDIMKTTGQIILLDEKYKFNKIFVDEVGIGSGVIDRLKEQNIGMKAFPINAGRSSDNKRFLNLKAEMYFNLRELFERQKLIIIDNNKLFNELMKMRYEITSNGKLKIIDPEKSPDYADSLAYGCYFTISKGNIALLEDKEGLVL